MVRPAKPEGARPHAVVIALNDEELDFVNFTAEDHGLHRGTYLRTLIREKMRDEKKGRGK